MSNGDPEIFASIQGEGISLGVPSVFVRLAECNLKCTWCFVPETPVLMADWSWRPIGELRPGDSIIGITRPAGLGQHLKLALGTVTRLSLRCAPTVIVNDAVRCTPDHKFWLTGRDATGRASAVHSGWREIARSRGLKALFVAEPVRHNVAAYERGWLAGMADGDGCFWTLKHRRGYRRFRLALNDDALLARAEMFAATAGHTLRRGTHSTTGFANVRREVNCLWLTADANTRAFEEWLREDVEDTSWPAGYLGGILDAEGSHSCGVLRISQDPIHQRTRARIEAVLRRLGLRYTVEEQGFYVHRRGGEAWRALSLSRPGKQSLLSGALGHHPHASRLVDSVVPAGELDEVVSITTTLGSFVAAGYVVKNCDTKYTWDWERHDRSRETAEVEMDDVVERIVRLAKPHTRNVVITGGEPLLQQPALDELANRLRRVDLRIEVETNGTIEPRQTLADQIDQWNVSPKLENSGNRTRSRLRAQPMAWFAASSKAHFKFVIAAEADLAEVQTIATQYGISSDRITVMPEAVDAETLASRSPWLVEQSRKHGFRFSTRLHILLWGSERGR